MNIEEEKQGSIIVVSPVGRVDGVGAPDLQRRLAEIAERREYRVLIDCEKMDYISSAGLRTVLIGARTCQQNGGALTLCALQPDCRSVLEMSGFLNIVKCYDTRGDAIADQPDADGV